MLECAHFNQQFSKKIQEYKNIRMDARSNLQDH